MQSSKVLVVDGDRASRDALVICLKFVGVEAHGAAGVNAADLWLSTGTADVLVLSDDIADGAPGEVALRSEAARAGGALILRLARGSQSARTNYLADDTLMRPVALSHVVQRIESLLLKRQARSGILLHFGSLVLNLEELLVTHGDRAVPLGPTEARMLAYFMRVPDKVFSRSQLLQRLWPSNVCVEERTVDVHVRRLRRALLQVGCDGCLQTVRGSGYRLSRFPA